MPAIAFQNDDKSHFILVSTQTSSLCLLGQFDVSQRAK
ncbi:hypothetical protein GNIT_3317 [Glaciecola nitratireducens FR1064]|uniref:Uncharacterized protein n=1 Tax=Glaciecola nitratireducens (strain JCM 12485 / KCTC 12276 / FR1064) TaxID=1085623 RepID=G4QMZ2_GLANF|nr:hypothetical protein GNIT_3317 [Glaciecola nitratireducens FR1064]